ncbi:hypothetical protein TanjilG_02762 [Lupinus angustifolius]|uniref:C2H2-type domain-containing protein n=1 Tax=Lupinus angustifolius TaxID=3871 RepID=A0A1J7GWU8_LUPAN|nr:PREDICTED: uncharacterized protein LOC109356198 [Lupinus angustifolius]OIW05055.1 hypothetical protein TanjilG_02762 [Lupinus angustifolius]
MKSPFSKASSSTNYNKDKADCDDDSNNNGDNDKKRTCYLCKKDFPSSHSLFGHMRIHSDRPWRGVRPSIHSHHHNDKHISSGFEEDHDDYDDEYDEVVASNIDISKSSSLLRWQKTGKRGRKSSSVYQAAEILMYMSSRSNDFLDIKSMMGEPKNHQPSTISCKGKNLSEASISGIKKNFESMNVEDAIHDHVHNFDEKEIKVMKLLVKKLKVPLHNKEKNNIVDMVESKSSYYAITQDATVRGSTVEAINNNEVQTEKDVSSSQFLGPKFLDFDLNMSPPHDDLDDRENC